MACGRGYEFGLLFWSLVFDYLPLTTDQTRIHTHYHPTTHQLAFLTPGISPLKAASRKQSRQSEKRRIVPRALPQRSQRKYARTLYFGFLCALTSNDFFDILPSG